MVSYCWVCIWKKCFVSIIVKFVASTTTNIIFYDDVHIVQEKKTYKLRNLSISKKNESTVAYRNFVSIAEITVIKIQTFYGSSKNSNEQNLWDEKNFCAFSTMDRGHVLTQRKVKK